MRLYDGLLAVWDPPVVALKRAVAATLTGNARERESLLAEARLALKTSSHVL